MKQTSQSNKPLASVSLDLDNKWSYMKTHGDSGWEKFPSYLDIFVPYVLDILDRLSLRITFFIVGQDAALEKNAEVLKLLTERGHEVGNHSFNHEPWLHLYSRDQIRREIIETEEHILRVTGQKPTGFRGPGFTWSNDLLNVIYNLGYLFDASTLPTYLGPLARVYYFRKSEFSEDEKALRTGLFGTFADGARPVKPYLWELQNGNRLLEIPVTTFPIIKTPFHLSYLLYLSKFSVILMAIYFKAALSICRVTRTQPSFLLHPLDLIGSDLLPELAFFPGMDVNSERKKEIFHMVFRELKRHFHLVNMTFHAQSILKQEQIKALQPCA